MLLASNFLTCKTHKDLEQRQASFAESAYATAFISLSLCTVMSQTCLVADIPNKLVLRSIEDVMEGHCEVSDTQTCPKMSSRAAHIVDHILSQLLAKLFQLPPVEVFYMDRVVDSI